MEPDFVSPLQGKVFLFPTSRGLLQQFEPIAAVFGRNQGLQDFLHTNLQSVAQGELVRSRKFRDMVGRPDQQLVELVNQVKFIFRRAHVQSSFLNRAPLRGKGVKEIGSKAAK